MRWKGTAAWVHGPARSSDQGQGKPSAEGRGRGRGAAQRAVGPVSHSGCWGRLVLISAGWLQAGGIALCEPREGQI